MATRRWLIDGSLAALAFGATLAILAAGGFGTPGPTARGLDPQGIVLAGLSAAPLAFRQVRPAWAYAVSTVASLALLDRGYPLDAPVAAAFAAYALALAYTGARPLPRGLALVAVNAFVPAVAVAYASVGIPPLSIATELLAWAAVFAGLWVAGDRTRLRRLQLAEAVERTRQVQASARARARRAEAEAAERDRRLRAEAERDRRLAAADERTRIARELHDSAGHAINVILVQAGAARLLQQRDPERARRALDTIETVARDTVADIDRMVRALRDDRDHEVPADPGALGELIARHRASGLAITADLPPATALPRSVAWAAYRILQEALTNAARHGAGTAEVAVRFGADRVEIEVTNPTVARPPDAGPRPPDAGTWPPGVGARPPGAGAGSSGRARAGLGIVGMRERATLLGGTLCAEAVADRFRLSAVLPHSDRQPAAAHPASARPASARSARAEREPA